MTNPVPPHLGGGAYPILMPNPVPPRLGGGAYPKSRGRGGEGAAGLCAAHRAVRLLTATTIVCSSQSCTTADRNHYCVQLTELYDY